MIKFIYPIDSTLSLNNLSILGILFSSIIVYIYFFGMLSEDRYKNFSNENKAKYFAVFSNIAPIIIIYAVLVIFLSLISKIFPSVTFPLSSYDFILIVTAMLNLFIGSSISKHYLKVFSNYKNVEFFSNLLKKGGEIENTQKNFVFDSLLLNSTSSLIFILTIEVVIFGYLLKINILTLLLLIFAYLLIHNALSQFWYLPSNRCSIQLVTGSMLNRVFVIRRISNEFIITLAEDDTIMQIPISSINQIFLEEPLLK
nr:hypothetical protein [uncultured Methanoregula sp.]